MDDEVDGMQRLAVASGRELSGDLERQLLMPESVVDGVRDGGHESGPAGMVVEREAKRD